jgi:hypothetical protein
VLVMSSSSSYSKTRALSLVAASGSCVVLVLPLVSSWPWAIGLAVLAGLAAMISLAAFVSSLVVIRRHANERAGLADLYLAAQLSRGEAAVRSGDALTAGPVRRLAARWLLGHDLLVGDEVEIMSLAEIQATLRADGTDAGIPFQSEMERFCGQRVRVYRCLDKIYDYGRTKKMRRLNSFVTLVGLRCDGAGHGNCQAMCYLAWSTRWLRRVTANATSGVAMKPAAAAGASAQTGPVYRCQFTQLHDASTPLRAWALLQDLRPLLAGNITTRAFFIAIATRYFNFIQGLRGGDGFPLVPLADSTPAASPTRLEPGMEVRVLPIEAIVRTLNKSSRNRGLWFDRDMIKHCGTKQTVLARIERIIDDATGEMRVMKTPCIVLDGVDYSGEYLHFNAQHDGFFWREAWLERMTR